MLTIRPVRASDAPAAERICLLTGNAGKSAEHLHAPSRGNLLGAVWAVPYVLMPHTWGFVLIDDALDTEDGANALDAVKGYILGTTDSEAFARAEEERWWPELRARYPLKPEEGEADPRTENDQRYIELIHRAPDPPTPGCLALSPAHMHIDLLPEVQRQGWGRKLIGRAVDELKSRGLGAVWLGLDLANVDAAKFYERVGFEMIEGEAANMRVLRFENWKPAV